jgi:nudix-type nucleoside diphosphatase (YffH/AdpP family)
MMADAAIRQIVLGQDVPCHAAMARDVALVDAGDWPVAVNRAGAECAGVLITGLSAEDLARFDFFMAVMGQIRGVVALVDGAPEVWTHVGQSDGPVWDAAGWAIRIGAVWRATAGDVMAQYGRVAPELVAARLGSMLVRGASRVRAGQSAPTIRRHRAGAGDMQIAAQRQPYAHFFAVEEYDMAWRRFDGAMSDTVTRAAFLSGDAVTVLPYDPRRDRVLVVEQFRAGPHARGDAQCWQIEAIAGRIDPGETPEEAARREAAEEAGLILTDLIEVARYYPSPGAVSEYLYSYVALTDLADDAAGVFGVAGETEDIRGHLLSFAELMELVGSGEIENAPLILTALWLQRERARLIL